MKPGVLAAVAATIAASVAAAAGFGNGNTQAVAADGPAPSPSACSAASLHGTYNYFIQGLKKQRGFRVPYVEVGHEIYDGAGNVATVSTNSLRRTTSHQFGTYSVHANCRGQAKYAAKKTKHWLFADPSGENASFLISDGAGTEGALGGSATRVSTQTRSALACSTQSLTGTYAYNARGLKSKKVYVETGFETYDGQGHFTNTYIDSHSRKVVHTTGTYTIAADCTGDARYAGGDSYHLYAAPDGSTFSWLQTKGLRTRELFGGLEHRISANAATGDPASPPGACSAASLKGTYNYVIHGLKKVQRYHVPYVEVGHEIYDGAGNVATVSTNSLRRTTSHQFGTYSVHANCRGQAKYAAKKTKHWLFADPSGENASFLITDGAGTEGALGGIATRASTQPRSQLACSTQSLTGTYAYHARGLKSKKIYVETGFETYDGQGHFTNTYTDSHSRKIVHTTGTYTIAADCTGDARYAGGDSYHLYAAPDGSTFSWLQTKGLRANELFGGLEHRISATPNEALTGERAVARATRAPQPRPDGVSIGGLFRFASVNFTPSVPAPSAACPNPTAEDPTCIQLKIDSSYTSYQGAPGTAGNEPTGVPLALNITFP